MKKALLSVFALMLFSFATTVEIQQAATNMPIVVAIVEDEVIL